MLTFLLSLLLGLTPAHAQPNCPSPLLNNPSGYSLRDLEKSSERCEGVNRRSPVSQSRISLRSLLLYKTDRDSYPSNLTLEVPKTQYTKDGSYPIVRILAEDQDYQMDPRAPLTLNPRNHFSFAWPTTILTTLKVKPEDLRAYATASPTGDKIHLPVRLDTGADSYRITLYTTDPVKFTKISISPQGQSDPIFTHQQPLFQKGEHTFKWPALDLNTQKPLPEGLYELKYVARPQNVDTDQEGSLTFYHHPDWVR